MRKKLRYLLHPDELTLLNMKLQTGQISPRECREILKLRMIQEYHRQRDRSFFDKTRIVKNLLKALLRIKRRILKPHPAQPSISTEELVAWMLPRHL